MKQVPKTSPSKHFFIVLNLLCSLMFCVLAGCSEHVREDDPEAYSAISFSAPQFFLAPGSSMQWRSDLVYLFGDARKKPENVEPVLQEEIQRYFEARTNVFPADTGVATYGLVAVVVLGDGLTAREVLKRFKLTPSFPTSRRYEKGTIVVAIYDAADETVLWRGAIQSNVDLDLPPEQRRQLIRSTIGKLLNKIPTRQPV